MAENTPAQLLRGLCKEVGMSQSVTKKRTHRGEWVEGLIAIGNDEVAYVTMSKSAYDLLYQYQYKVK